MFTIDLEKMARILKMANEVDVDKLEKRLKFNRELGEYNREFFKFNLRTAKMFLECQKKHKDIKIMDVEDIEYMMKRADDFDRRIRELYGDVVKEKI